MNHVKNIIRFFSNANTKSKKTGKTLWRTGAREWRTREEDPAAAPAGTVLTAYMAKGKLKLRSEGAVPEKKKTERK